MTLLFPPVSTLPHTSTPSTCSPPSSLPNHSTLFPTLPYPHHSMFSPTPLWSSPPHQPLTPHPITPSPLPSTTSNPHYPHHTSSTSSLLHILTFHAITPPLLTLTPHPNFTFSLLYTLTPPPSHLTPHTSHPHTVTAV